MSAPEVKPEVRAPLPEGTKLQGGLYELGPLVGTGGFSLTYMAYQGTLRLPVAIKEFFPNGTVRREGSVYAKAPWTSESFLSSRDNFQREGDVISRFHHPGIVRVHGQFQENHTSYLVEELLEGETLGEGLARAGVMPVAQALQVLLQVGQALMLVHAGGLVHSDIKPDNLFWTHDGRYVILDFGVSRGYLSDKASKDAMAAVSPGFSPPEQYERNAKLAPAADVYSLCATLYQLLGGVAPLDARRRLKGDRLLGLRATNPTVTPEIEQAIFMGLQLDLKKRTSSIRQLMESLNLETNLRSDAHHAVPEFTRCAEASAHPGGVHVLAMHAESGRLYSGGRDGRVCLWSWPDLRPLGALVAHQQSVNALAISPDGGYLLTGSQNGEVRLWDTTQGQVIQNLLSGGPAVQKLCFHPEGGIFAAGFTDGRCALLGPSLPSTIAWQAHKGSVNALDISPDGVLLASGADDKQIHLWRLPDGRFLRTLAGHDRLLQSVHFSPDGRLLLSGSNDLSVRLWDLGSSLELRHLKGHRGMVWDAAFTANPELVVTISADRCLRAYRVDTGRMAACSEAHEGWTRALAVDLNQGNVATGGADGFIRCWRLDHT